MTRKRPNAGRLIPAFAACFAVGVVTGWWLRGGPPQPSSSVLRQPALADVPDSPVGASFGGPPPAVNKRSERTVATTGRPDEDAIEALRHRNLRLPIDGAGVEVLKGMFGESRDGRAHEAVDILAPRNTPIHAVEDGTIAKLFSSKAGGLTIYQFDPAERFCYYYAHLERYASGLHEGQHVTRGEVIGYVGTSGNAPANTPHLHFAVFELGPDRRWWKGRPIDPYLVLRQATRP